MVNAKFLKDAGPAADMSGEMETPYEQLMDGADDQMENIEKMMRPLTQVHPAAIIAGTVVAGIIVLILVVKLLNKNNEMKARAESKRVVQITNEDQILSAFCVNSAEEDTKEALANTKALTDSEMSLTESAAEEQEEVKVEDNKAFALKTEDAAKAEEAAKAEAIRLEEVARAEQAAKESEARRVVEAARQEEESRLAREAKEKALAEEAAAKAEEEARVEAARVAKEEELAKEVAKERALAEEAAVMAKYEAEIHAEEEAKAVQEEALKEITANIDAAAKAEEEAEMAPTARPVQEAEVASVEVASVSACIEDNGFTLADVNEPMAPVTMEKTEADNGSNSSNESFEHLEPEEVALAVAAEEPKEAEAVTPEPIQQADEPINYGLNLSIPGASSESEEGVVKSEFKISLSPKPEIKPRVKRNISRVELQIVGGSPVGDASYSPSEEAAVGGVEMTAVLEAMVAVAAGEKEAAEPEEKAEEPEVIEPSPTGGADFRSVTIQETKERLVDTEDGKESSV